MLGGNQVSSERPSEDELPVQTLDAVSLLVTLAHHGAEFVVIGGFSRAAHGLVRATKDLLVVPNPAPQSSASLARWPI